MEGRVHTLCCDFHVAWPQDSHLKNTKFGLGNSFELQMRRLELPTGIWA